MDWVRGLPSVVFWWGWGMVALLVGGSLYATWWARRNSRRSARKTQWTCLTLPRVTVWLGDTPLAQP